jgi:chemotaxis protein MotB
MENTDEILISTESRGLIIRLKDTILFDPGSDIIKDKARKTLDKLAGILKEIPNSVRIEGHTDKQPINTSRFPSNWELSTARATNIVKYLIENHKLNPQNLSAVGYGEYMPVKKISSNEDQAVNRRVDIVILSSISKVLEPCNIEN